MPRPNLSAADCLGLVGEEIRTILARRSPSASEPLRSCQNLTGDLGFSSADLVELAAALEKRLALSSSRSLPLSSFKTVDDICHACLASLRESEGLPDAALAASVRRGQARRLQQ